MPEHAALTIHLRMGHCLDSG